MADFSKYYRAYMYMQELLKNDFTYNYINEGFKDGDKGNDSLDGKTNEKVIDMDWVVAIEETLPYIQKAIDEQRRFIKQVDNVVRIELARKVGPESVKHLSQHTNFIAKVDDDGMVTPNKILTTEREESFAIYENRVLMTLIRKALIFVDDKYSKMKDVPNDSYNRIQMERHVNFNDKKIDFTINYVNESHDKLADDLDVLDVSELSDFDRIRRIRSTLNEFLNTQLMREIAKEPEVRPPITQTNLLKKNPNFKKAMELWTFLDSYKRTGFEIVSEDYQGKMDEQVQQDVYFAMGFEHFMMSIATNPGLRNILQQKYEEENARIAEEEAKPEKIRESVLKAQIDAVRKEEMEIRLREIREREKKILDLTNEVKNLKVTLEQKEQQILTLKGQISALQDQINELKEELKQTKLKLLEAENEIKALKEENQALKDKIEELNKTIDELNNKIAELNEQIRVLNDRIQVLMQENARMQSKIEEQEKIIEEQTARIDELEKQTAEQLAKIAALTDNLAKCEAEIESNKKEISSLTQRNEKLVTTLQNERTAHKEKVEQMNADFAAKSKAAEEQFKSEKKSLQKQIDDSEAAHTKYVAQLNAEFADKANLAEQKRINELAEKQAEHEKQIEQIKLSNDKASAAVEAKHASEVRKVQKSVNKRVEAAQKAAEKQYNAKIKELKSQQARELAEVKRKAKEEIRLAKQKAKAEIRLAKQKARKNMFTKEELIEMNDIIDSN
ncbi:hypothetical protein [Ruminococcus sp.]|uniref:hypothetical protein n=1 Tax=Ruminococcus sp. TaxID=41978 RepID=UPI0026238FB6|nr:hypothetical protein [Ruminococcus sp.]MDD6989654.1 hypothetical protein [Ruminococcus sp.]MDY6202564.1 hypothetical protein [Ruminococcus sp.]